MSAHIPLLEDAFRWTLGSSIRVSVLIILVFLAQKLLARHLTSGLRGIEPTHRARQNLTSCAWSKGDHQRRTTL